MTIRAAHDWPTNGHLILDVARLGYLHVDGLTFDATYKNGIFWQQWRPERLITADLDAGVKCNIHADFTKPPFRDFTFDSVVYDPPYKLNGTPEPAVDGRYGVGVATPWQDRMKLIEDGLYGLAPLVKYRGTLLVKCMDQVCSGAIRWQTDMVTEVMFREMGFDKVDEFHLLGGGREQPEGRRQVHAYFRPSTLLVFRRPVPKRPSTRIGRTLHDMTVSTIAARTSRVLTG